jgi:hypothetical protein
MEPGSEIEPVISRLLNGRSPMPPGGGVYWRFSLLAMNAPFLRECSTYCEIS